MARNVRNVDSVSTIGSSRAGILASTRKRGPRKADHRKFRSKYRARENTGICGYVGRTFTVRRTTEIRLNLRIRGVIRMICSRIHGGCNGACVQAAAKNPVVLLSKKLTLKEDRPVKQLVCHSKKTESAIRISRSGSKAARPSTTISKSCDYPRRAHGRWMRPGPR